MEVKEVLVRFGVPVRKTSGSWSTGVQMWRQLVVEADLEKLLGDVLGTREVAAGLGIWILEPQEAT